MKLNEFNQEKVIIIDNGSGYIKNGFNSVIDFEKGVNSTSTIIGHPRYKSLMSSMGKFKPYYIGNEVYDKTTKGLLDINQPIKNGIINNWDDIEKIWELTLLNLSPSSSNTTTSTYPVLLTETFNNPKKYKERMAEIMFEKFDIPSLFIANQSLLSYYSSSSSSTSTSTTFDNNALIVDIGHGVTQLVPISNGQPIKESSINLNFISGDEISKNLLKDYQIDNFEILNKIKEKFIISIDGNESPTPIPTPTCTVSNSNNPIPDETTSSTTTTTTTTYTLPDGKIIEIDLNDIKNNVENTLFKPSSSGNSTSNNIGLHQAIHSLILKYKLFKDNDGSGSGDSCDSSDDLYKNIILTGGTSMINGFNNRLLFELKNSLPSSSSSSSSIKISINSPIDHNRKYSVFKGGCMFSSLSNFNLMCVSRSEYNETK